MLETIRKTWTSLNRSISVNQRELVLGCALCVLTGLTAGMLISPRKTVAIGSNNGGNVVDKRTLTGESEPVPESDEIPF